MRKLIAIIISLILMCTLVSCSRSTPNQSTKEEHTETNNNTATQINEENEFMNKTLSLKIGNTIVEVDWLENDSVDAIKELAKDGLTIKMSMYGGFEQVGSIGTSIVSSDTRITTNPGDIVLYSSNQIVIFYGSNTWAYTKLGHINLSKSELTNLLGNGDVIITITLK